MTTSATVEDRILAIARRQRDESTDAKRQAFERLKTEAPDVAAFVSSVSSVFGRPAYIAIKFTDGTVYRHGRQS